MQVENINWNQSYGIVKDEPQYSTIDYSEEAVVHDSTSDSTHQTEAPPTDSAYYISEQDIGKSKSDSNNAIYDTAESTTDDNRTLSPTTPTDLISDAPTTHTYLSIIGGVAT